MVAAPPGLIALFGESNSPGIERDVLSVGVYDVISDIFEDDVLAEKEIRKRRSSGPMCFDEDAELVPVELMDGFVGFELDGLPYGERAVVRTNAPLEQRVSAFRVRVYELMALAHDREVTQAAHGSASSKYTIASDALRGYLASLPDGVALSIQTLMYTGRDRLDGSGPSDGESLESCRRHHGRLARDPNLGRMAIHEKVPLLSYLLAGLEIIEGLGAKAFEAIGV